MGSSVPRFTHRFARLVVSSVFEDLGLSIGVVSSVDSSNAPLEPFLIFLLLHSPVLLLLMHLLEHGVQVSDLSLNLILSFLPASLFFSLFVLLLVG